MKGMLTFCTLPIGALTVLVTGGMLCAATPTTTPSSADMQSVRFPTFGIELTPPHGWAQVWEADLATVGRWTHPSARQPIDTLLYIGVAPRTVVPSARTQADEIAKRSGSPVEETTLDGVKAFRVQLANAPLIMITAERNGQVYSINYGRKIGFDPKELEVLRKTWLWHDPQTPAKHINLDPTPILIFDRFGIMLPSCMRPNPEAPDGHALFAAYDFTTGQAQVGFQLELTMPAEVRDLPINEIAASLGRDFGALSHEDPPLWRKAHDGSRIISDPITAKANGRQIQLGVIAVNEHDRVVATLITFLRDLDSRKAGQALAEDIVRSINAAGAPTTIATTNTTRR